MKDEDDGAPVESSTTLLNLAIGAANEIATTNTGQESRRDPDLLGRLQALERENEALKETVTNTINAANADKADMEAKLSATEGKVGKLEEENKQARDTMDDIYQEEITELQENHTLELETLEQENNSQLIAKDAELKAKDAELKAKDAEVKAKDAEVKAKDAEVKAKDAELASFSESKQMLQFEVTNLQEALCLQQEASLVLQQSLERLQGDVLEERKALQLEISELQSSIAIKQAEIVELSALVSSSTEKIVVLDSVVPQLDNELSVAQQRVEELQDQVRQRQAFADKAYQSALEEMRGNWGRRVLPSSPSRRHRRIHP